MNDTLRAHIHTLDRRRVPGEPRTQSFVVPGSSDCRVQVGADGLARYRCRVCNGYTIVDTKLLDTTKIVRLNHRRDCPVEQESESRRSCSDADALALAAAVNEDSREAVKGELN